ncbi:MAG: ribonuclease HI [Sphingomonadales bacterium]|nr:ribonuclease HI [Sphingomonadales bacterium]
MAEVFIYTDGAAKGNPGPGGYGVVLMSGTYRMELSAGYQHTTNNRMELMAVLAGLKALKGTGHQVWVYSDSRYVVNAINQNWLKGWAKKGFKNVKNPDLWKELIPLLRLWSPRFVWVKGHADNIHNNRCDQLATQAADTADILVDEGYINNLSTNSEDSIFE